MKARVWLNQASIVSLVSLVFRDRMVAAGAAGKEWFANILKKNLRKLVSRSVTYWLVMLVAVVSRRSMQCRVSWLGESD